MHGCVPGPHRLSLLLLALALATAAPLAAHEVPARVTVNALVRPDGARLHVLLRVPLEAIRDVDFPQHGAGYLDLSATAPLLTDAARLWLLDYLEVFENGRKLEGDVARARISLPSDRSLASWDAAIAHMAAPLLDDGTQLVWSQAMLDVLVEYPITAADSRFALHPRLAHLGVTTTTVLRFLPRTGVERAFTWTGDPGMVQLEPRWHHAASSFLRLGFLHILGGLDHLLFLLCLVIPLRDLRALVVVVTSFTVAHSITLAAAAFGLAPAALWFPPLIEVLIAASIVYMAFENIVGARSERRWVMAFAFGLVHGFGFSFMLSESLQFAGSHLALSLLAFNAGVELGQLLVLLLVLPALALLFRVVRARIGAILLSALVAHSAWHWMTARGSALLQYDVALPALDAAFALAALRFATLALLTALAALAMHALARRFATPALPGTANPGTAD